MNPQILSQLGVLIDTNLKFLQLSSFGMKRACDDLLVARSMQKKASALAPTILTLMVKTGAVREDQKNAAAAMLGSHAETLQLLKSAVEELAKARATKKAGDLGEGIDERSPGLENGKAAYDSVTDGYVGKKTSQKKASDLAILAVLESPTR